MVILKRADERGNRVAMCDPSRVNIKRGEGGYVKPETVLMGAGICGKAVGMGKVEREAEEVKSEPEVEVEESPEMPPESERESLPVPQEGCVVEKEPDVQELPLGEPVSYCEIKERECEEVEEAVAHPSGEMPRESRRERRRKRKHRHGI